jgi:hypothetical protein
VREVLDYLAERSVEFDRHLYVARLLEARVDDAVADDGAQVEVRHVNTLKSGLLIHLYNIVEAVSVQTMDIVGQTVVTEKPRFWTEAVLKEWVRSAVWDGNDRLGEGAISRLASVSSVLASGESPIAFKIKGEPGSWDDGAIKKLAARLGCHLVLENDTQRAAYERVYRNDTTAMSYLAGRRNAIAHGATTFEEGARDHTLDEIALLAGRIFPYLKAVSESYGSFLSAKDYLTPRLAA